MNRAQTVLTALVAAAEEDGFGAHGLHVRIGDETARHLWSPDDARDVHSVAKGVCVLACGIAADAVGFDVDAPVARYLPDLATGPGVDGVTTRELLGMRSGVDLPWSSTLLTDWPDLAAEFLSRPADGTTFQYSNASTYTAMRVLAAVVGDVVAFLGTRLFLPLLGRVPVWDRCPLGFVAAGEGLHLHLDELAELGRFVRDGGVHGGRVLVSRRWIEALHTNWTEREAGPGYTRYALAGWGGPGAAWRLHGAYGQLLIFLGEAVVTITADDHVRADRMAERVVAELGRAGVDAR
ncbi:serine hydrolase domain-containing protein [Kineococcus gynurae]|uniref:Serine hydrolase domain-containing protein n=1 Tax=Kineococcus gynurae TaxID=452979 RepID=A0ABV5LWB6_9ACTN